MAINSKDLLKTGDFITRFFSAVQVVPTGASGDLFTLTPPQGQRVKLTGLISDAATVPDLTITIGGSTVIDSKGLTNGANEALNRFSINGGTLSTGKILGHSIVGGVGEALVANAGAPMTTEIRYEYQFGE